MNLTQMQSSLYGKLSLPSAPSAAVVSRLLGFLNETHREILGMKGFGRMRRAVLPFSSIANNPYCVLPQAAAKIITIVDRVNSWPLDEVSLPDLRFMDPGLTSVASYPTKYVILNLGGAVALDPSSADRLYVKSDSASDVGTAYVEGVVTGGYFQTASVVMTGATAVQLGTLATWIAVRKFYLSATAVGTVKLLQTSGAGTELSRIPIGDSYARYSQLQLFPTPTAANTYYADVEVFVSDMASASDQSLLPTDFAWLLPCGAAVKELAKREKSMAYGLEMSRWRNGVADLRSFLKSPTGTAWSERRRRAWSMLGSNFPANGWGV